MGKGVKKIQCVGGKIYPKRSVLNKSLVIPPDQDVLFDVKEWGDNTTETDKKKSLTWIWQTSDVKRNIIGQLPVSPSMRFKFKLPKKLCGPYTYYIEASLSGKRDFKNFTGLYVKGSCPSKVISTKWCTSKDGKDERSNLFCYGEKIFLSVSTEGLNGNLLTVEIYRIVKGDILGSKKDDKIKIIPNVPVIDGEINVEIVGTALWPGQINKINILEQFYVKIKDAFGNYIIDEHNDTSHARFLKIKNEIITQSPKKPENKTAAKVGETDKKHENYGLCSFEKINIVHSKNEEGKIAAINCEAFNKGKINNKLKRRNGATVFEIVASSSETKILVDVIDFKNKCFRNDNKHKKNIIVKSSEFEGNGQIKKESSSIEIPVHSTLSYLNPAPMQYFWPSKGNVARYNFYANTCSYFNNANDSAFSIIVYPDIKWVLKFEYNSKNPIKYRDTWVKMRQSRINDAYNNAQAGDLDGYDGNLETEFKVALGAEFDDSKQKFDFSKELKYKIERLIKIFLGIKRGINYLIGDTEDGGLVKKLPNSVKEQMNRTASKLGRLPMNFTIMSPGLSAEFSWYLASRDEPFYEVVTMIEGEANFGPLIGGKGTLDLIAVAEYIPYIGQVVKAVDVSLNTLGFNTVFALSAVGEVSLKAKLNTYYSELTKLHIQDKSKYLVELAGKFGLEVELSVKGKWEFKTFVIVGDEHELIAEGSAKATSYIKPSIGIEADEKGIFIRAKADFDGLKIVLEIKGGFDKVSRSRVVNIVIVEEKKDIINMKKYFND